VLQCGAVCCRVFRCVAMYSSVLQCVAVCCSVCCSVLRSLDDMLDVYLVNDDERDAFACT